MASKKPSMQGRCREKRLLMTKDEEIEINDTLLEMRRVLGFGANFSELTRVGLTVILQHEKEVLKQLKGAKEELRRPQTLDFEGALDFEIRLAELVGAAIKKAR